jgi:hypothetical protein
MTQSGPPVPLAEAGIARFEALADELPRLLDRLRRAPVWNSGRDGPLPAVPGVYLLSEEHPIYVGQTHNLRRRLRQHGGISSRENQALPVFPWVVGGRVCLCLAGLVASAGSGCEEEGDGGSGSQ